MQNAKCKNILHTVTNLGGIKETELPMSDNRLFIERRPEGQDYAVRKPGSKRASAVLPTQGEAIEWAKQKDGDIFVERVRKTKCGNPDKWRRP